MGKPRITQGAPFALVCRAFCGRPSSTPCAVHVSALLRILLTAIALLEDVAGTVRGCGAGCQCGRGWQRECGLRLSQRSLPRWIARHRVLPRREGGFSYALAAIHARSELNNVSNFDVLHC